MTGNRPPTKNPKQRRSSKRRTPGGVLREESISLAVRNIAFWGDTDVLPFPLENHWFHDDEESVIDLLKKMDREFWEWSSEYPLVCERVLATVGYMGFRGVTQIDSIWNAYLLALVIELGPKIENKRLSVADQRVFSYRFSPDLETYSLFDRSVGWNSYQDRALLGASEGGFVVSTDIADFYPRVYHHRVKNSLDRVTDNKEAVKRIDHVLSRISAGGVSYGLPVGGNAARLLAEILLNRTDRLLLTRGVEFCRFVDDYYLFSETESAARGALVYLSEILLNHEGLTLKRSKTRLMTGSEFLRLSPLRARQHAESDVEEEVRQFLSLRLMYDPYSPNADEDYEKLKADLQRFDILGMLTRELRKSRVDESLVRRLVKCLRYLDEEVRNSSVQSLLASIDILHPVIPTVLLVIKHLVPVLPAELQAKVFGVVRDEVKRGSHTFKIPANLAFALRLLVDDPSDETDVLMAGIFRDADLPLLIKRDIILCMARRRTEHWLADTLRRSASLNSTEKRYLIPVSFVLGDEGAHWRKRIKNELGVVDAAFLSWVSSKNNGGLWEIPV